MDQGPIDNKLALIQVVARHWSGDNPLPPQMVTQFTDAYMQYEKLGKLLTGSMYDLVLNFRVIPYVYRSFNKTTFTMYCLAQWISKLPGSFEVHWARQYLVNLMDLAGTVNATVYKPEPIYTGFGHGKLP